MTARSTTTITLGADNPTVEVRSMHYGLSEADLVMHAVRNGEGMQTASGALRVTTGAHTGRSAKDKYIVDRSGITDAIWWDGNQRLAPDAYEILLDDVIRTLAGTTVYVQDVNARTGADEFLHVRMINSLAWHALFIRNLLISGPPHHTLGDCPELTVINLPEFTADPDRHQCRSGTIIALDIARSLILICGTAYGGENKKSVFSYLNYLLPARKIFPMHCSASYPTGHPEAPCLFFGLSGTGKTTLSTDESLTLVGDDEHGWSDDGVFTIEGGCYAKTQGLDPGKEADIHAASTQFGTVLENVIIDPATNMPDFSDTCLTENTRSAYDISKIPGAAASGCAGHPRHVFLLACDAFGVLPPIARLTHQQAVDIFMTGYTSKVAGTERGIRTPTPVFSECYARPFLPRPPSVYRVMFLERIRSSKSQCWLINTGWQGGPAGTGQRIALEYTRRIIAAAINNELGDVDTDTLPFLDLQIPTSIDGIPGALLNPAHAWPGDGYNQAAGKLADMISRHMSSSDPRKSGSMPN